MNETEIYTNDTRNNCVYSTTDKLYLAYGEEEGNDQYITVGANGSDNNIQSLNTALRVDVDYWGNSYFWLCAPNLKSTKHVTNVIPHSQVHRHFVLYNLEIVPAFELNLSSVFLASAAQAASSTGNLSLRDTSADGNGAFTLRYKSDNLGSALVSYDKSEVMLTDVPSGTYLVVQNKAGAKAKQITNETTVSASDMGLNNFANCKLWLETTDTANRMIYATLATEEQVSSERISVNISANKGINITSNNGTQKVGKGNAITDITVEVEDGYFLSDDYISNLQTQLSPLTVSETDKGFIISGTPTSDMNITLPQPTLRTYTITVNPTSLTFDTKNEGYSTDGISKSVTITNTGNSKVTLVNPTSTSYDVSLSVTELEPNGTATLTITPKASLTAGTYNETIEVKTKENTSASVDVSFKVNGALNVTLNASETSITEGESVTLTANAQGGSGNYSYVWYVNDVEDTALQGKEVTISPTKTTTYKVVVTDMSENKSSTATITVNPKMEVVNEVPTINVSDKTLTVGNTFDALKDVTAIDKEDGSLTNKIEVLNNTVNIDKAGVYEVTYKVTDSKGASTVKTITVTVIEKDVQPPVTSENPDNTDSPETGDMTNLGLFASMFIGSSGALALLSRKRRQNKKNK